LYSEDKTRGSDELNGELRLTRRWRFTLLAPTHRLL
jgi:hypothetical protein